MEEEGPVGTNRSRKVVGRTLGFPLSVMGTHRRIVSKGGDVIRLTPLNDPMTFTEPRVDP